MQAWLSRNIGKSLVKLSKKHKKHWIYKNFTMTNKSCRGRRKVLLSWSCISFLIVDAKSSNVASLSYHIETTLSLEICCHKIIIHISKCFHMFWILLIYLLRCPQNMEFSMSSNTRFYTVVKSQKRVIILLNKAVLPFNLWKRI